jgi:hypothetical protein
LDFAEETMRTIFQKQEPALITKMADRRHVLMKAKVVDNNKRSCFSIYFRFNVSEVDAEIIIEPIKYRDSANRYNGLNHGGAMVGGQQYSLACRYAHESQRQEDSDSTGFDQARFSSIEHR